MANNAKESERAELHKTIWRIANDLRGSADGFDFKTYVLGMLFYRFISENLTSALALCGNKDAKGIVLLKPYAEYYQEYQQQVPELVEEIPLSKAIVGESAQKASERYFGLA